VAIFPNIHAVFSTSQGSWIGPPGRADKTRRGAVLGLLAALLFGASAPFAKLLLAGAGPILLAGLLYAGAGIALTILTPIFRGRLERHEARLRLSDLPTLLTIASTGGIMGPVLMLVGLERVSGMTGSLLLNLEGSLTALLAVLVFREHLERRALLGSVSIFVGAATLSSGSGSTHPDLGGVLALVGACACWAIDNNLTQKLSLRSPVAVVRFKTLSSGSCLLAISAATGGLHASAPTIGWALLLGTVSYGVSVLLDMYALRSLGAAREAAFFATAPFAGALLAIPILGERPTIAQGVAGGLMLCGVVLLLRSRHDHVHDHAEIEHDHVHVHDEHHSHEHDGPVEEPHAHLHRHPRLLHEHPHVSDLHHRHDH
jgi:drug/metabolite transporter (DMT)-like permease